MKNALQGLKESLNTIIQSLEYEFVGCEILRHGRDSTLRIYIDSPLGITVDDCSKVSYQVSAFLDVEDPIQGNYTLEVSSPGLDRPLFESHQYPKFVGCNVKVKTFSLVSNRRNFSGKLVATSDENITILVDQDEVIIPFSLIEKAKLVADKSSIGEGREAQ